MEEWRDVVGYEGMYKVSNCGNIYSNLTNRILKPHYNKLGYARLILRKNGNSYGCSVHRLVAYAFLPNPNNFICVNHKDENPSNNSVANLEWCTQQYNSTYGTAIQRRVNNTNYERVASQQRIKVVQFDLLGNFIRTWASAIECKKACGFDNSAIAKCCNGKQPQSNGFIWRYVNDEEGQQATHLPASGM